jgi:hypothetical protein
MCKATGDISEDDLSHPVTRTACQNCGTILLINPETGKVDAHKSPLKDAPNLETSATGSTGEPKPVLDMRPQNKDARDWTAPIVVVIILVALISVGFYLVINVEIM